MEEQFRYDIADKENCWYKDICDKSKCGDTFCIRHYKMQALVQRSMLGDKQQHSIPLSPDEVDYDAFMELRNIKSDIHNFVTDGKNLLIYSSNTGNGKTEWSIKMLLAWFNSIWSSTDFECRGLFVSLPRFVRAMKENFNKPNDYYEYVNANIVNADLVVWDEINYKEWTAFEQDYMLDVLSQRIAMGKANIYTTNYNINDIQSRLGTRLSSRIIGCSKCIELKGKDKRRWGVMNSEN